MRFSVAPKEKLLDIEARYEEPLFCIQISQPRVAAAEGSLRKGCIVTRAVFFTVRDVSCTCSSAWPQSMPRCQGDMNIVMQGFGNETSVPLRSSQAASLMHCLK